MLRGDRPAVPLPAGWPCHAQAAVLHAVALARFALMHVRGWCADSRLGRVRLAGERDIAIAEVAQLREQLRILRARMATIPAARRPRYPPTERLAILTLRAATGWTVAETATRFQVAAQTVRNWMKRVDEDGERALLQLPAPVNRFPELVAHIVQSLSAALPALGKVRIANMLTRAGLHIAPTTVGRMRKRPPPTRPAPTTAEGEASRAVTEAEPAKPKRRVTARASHHTWHVDLTVLPTTGSWVSWLPFALPPVWPFCFWCGVVLDHFSRAVVAYRMFRRPPSADDVCALLDDAATAAGTTPRYIISDQGAQFQSDYRGWCEQHGVRPRFGAVGKHGSIAVLERFFRSLKEEMLRRLVVVRNPSTNGVSRVARGRGTREAWRSGVRGRSRVGGRSARLASCSVRSRSRGRAWRRSRSVRGSRLRGFTVGAES